MLLLLAFFLPSAPVLRFEIVAVSVYVLYIVHAREWDGEGETGKLLGKSYSYSRVEYLQKNSLGVYGTNE